ncbi:hypothetical protein B0H13DRAFT_2364377 [Mycena leptocephala]|nr:hypothetical protein B0H13DRAFT_2364377 [Mycena leptocephala]
MHFDSSNVSHFPHIPALLLLFFCYVNGVLFSDPIEHAPFVDIFSRGGLDFLWHRQAADRSHRSAVRAFSAQQSVPFASSSWRPSITSFAGRINALQVYCWCNWTNRYSNWTNP